VCQGATEKALKEYLSRQKGKYPSDSRSNSWLIILRFHGDKYDDDDDDSDDDNDEAVLCSNTV
jgi:hypothetical protein